MYNQPHNKTHQDHIHWLWIKLKTLDISLWRYATNKKQRIIIFAEMSPHACFSHDPSFSTHVLKVW